jgi:TIR domain
MPNLLRLYVSVSPSDLAFCQELVAQAGTVGVAAWFDRSAQHDSPFTDKHRQEILNRPACLVVLSPASFASSQMRDEHTYIATLLLQQPERIVLPLVAQPFEPDLLDEWPLHFPQLQRGCAAY